MLRKVCCTSHAGITPLSWPRGSRTKSRQQSAATSFRDGNSRQGFAWRTACGLHRQTAVWHLAALHLIPSFSDLATGSSSLGQLRIRFLATGVRHYEGGCVLPFRRYKYKTRVTDGLFTATPPVQCIESEGNGWVSGRFCHQYQLCSFVLTPFASQNIWLPKPSAPELCITRVVCMSRVGLTQLRIRRC
ncbi:hypothetical protein CGRA01v4_08709 [Colletotrichum graminicola]|nr:hypothetical protein CGRA01v4_08709 [Colletotrichum graminicola]